MPNCLDTDYQVTDRQTSWQAESLQHKASLLLCKEYLTTRIWKAIVVHISRASILHVISIKNTVSMYLWQ